LHARSHCDRRTQISWCWFAMRGMHGMLHSRLAAKMAG
jgi:hypothetical protein